MRLGKILLTYINNIEYKKKGSNLKIHLSLRPESKKNLYCHTALIQTGNSYTTVRNPNILNYKNKNWIKYR